ncbi:beta strand repeat-containing protein [Sphingopyxis macrogoltabida]|uniref:Uncharacterized protein n=1 Tax=Sphingopyxis macrogoltabida TaxID=33050 RepID=A0AAC8YZE8_SPHMC|nr:calcium-binding protein [Sphingopyxis macrogoltabida]ALJ13765.1 hypothetical protein LH19_12885 [Sphingopyxis macrogoltabida]AMU88794.1 hypothetical protein ATM17_07020 [Sphingopyxis macrogoltabida]
MPDNKSLAPPRASSGTTDGSGVMIGDGIMLTAGHVMYEFNENDTNRQIRLLSGATLFYDPRSYYSQYVTRVAGLSTPLPVPTGGHTISSQFIEINIVNSDIVFLEYGGGVGKDDAGMAVYLESSDIFSANFSLTSGTKFKRWGMTTGTEEVNSGYIEADSVGLKITDTDALTEGGDSGGGNWIDFEGKQFIVGNNVSSNLTAQYSKSSYISSNEFYTVNDMLAYRQATGDVTESEPTNLIVGRATADVGSGVAKGTYRRDIVLGRGGDDELSDGDMTFWWASDRLFGGDGDDALTAGNGDDLLHGGDFRDYTGSGRTSLEDDGEDTVQYETTGLRGLVGAGLTVFIGPASSVDAPAWTFGTIDPGDKSAAFFVLDQMSSPSEMSFGNDTLISIEHIKLTDMDDVVRLDVIEGDQFAGSDGKGGIAEIKMEGNATGPGEGDLIDASRNSANLSIDLSATSSNVKARDDSSGNKSLTILGAERVWAGSGDDIIKGNDKDNEIEGGGGEDTVDYSSSSNPITITFDGTAESATITVKDGMGGTDTLALIEKIIGTTKYDFVQVNGEIPTDTELTIDAYGGQSPNAFGSILNGSSSTKEIELDIDGSGNGYIRSVGGGEITLEGFHTQVIGSALNDSLSDASDGKKRLDGGAGNDTISTAGSTGNATIYGGDGDDTLTGGDGNDVIYGDQLENWNYNENIINGGAGSDFIVSSSAYDIIDGGSGNDYIKLDFASGSYDDSYSSDLTVDGGEDDDVIEVAGFVSVDVVLAAGSGHDTVITPASILSPASLGTNLNIVMDGLDYDDFTIVIDATPTSGSFSGFADIAVVIDATGDSVFLPNQYVHANDHGGSTAFSIISFNGSQLNPLHHVVFGSTSAYATDLSGFNAATAPDPGDTTGTSGDDHLAGGSGDDSLSGGDGNDNFETSGGNDSIDGGAGEDTLNLFGSRAQFTISGNAGSMTLTDNIGREGELTATGIERIFFVSDGEFYNVGDFFGYEGTAGADVITASDHDNDIQGFGGNDTIKALGGDDVIDGGEGDDLIDGGDGNDVANYSGSSTDYIVTRLSGGGATIETTGLGINDGTDTLQGVESIYFAGDDVTLDINTLPLGGTNGDDILIGGEGDDVIEGGDGNDILQGGVGYDLLDGGDGNDTAYYSGKSTDYSVYLWTDGSVYVDDYSESGADGSDELVDIEALYFAGDDTTVLIPADLPPLGTSGNDVILGTNRHDTLVGLEGDDVLTDDAGNDYLDGGEGADTMTGGEGDDTYVVDDSGDLIIENANEGYDSVESSVSYTLGANLESLSLWNGVTAINGTGNALDNSISGDGFGNTLLGLDGNDQLTGWGGDDILDGGNGDDTANYFGLSSDFEAFREIDGSVTVVDLVGSAGEDTLSNIEHLNFSYGGNVIVDVADLPLRGTASNDTLNGGSGNDTLFGLGGNDRLTGGAGHDVLDGGAGASDVAVFAGTQASHTIATNAGVVTIADNQPATDGNDGTDTVIGIEIAEFKGGVQVGITSPIVLDLNGDGVSLVNNRDTNVAFDWDGDGTRNQTGWIGRDDGFLMFDRDGNGLVSNGSELSFTSDKPGATSDLDGLRAFDSNGDGVFSSSDEKFGEFKIWRDANGNGRSETREIRSLADVGIASIDLSGEAVNRTWAWGDNMVINNGSFTRTDGSTGAFGDIALNYDPLSRQLIRPSLLHDRIPQGLPLSLDIDRAAARFSEAIAGFMAGSTNVAELRFDDHAMMPRDIHFVPVREAMLA